MDDTEYADYVEKQVDLYTLRTRSNQPPTMDEIVADLAPGHPLNITVRNMVKMWGHTEAQFDKAMKQAEREVKREVKNERIASALGSLPNGAEEFVDLYTAKNKIRITYQGKIIGAGREAAISLPRRLRLERNRLGLPLNDQSVSDGLGEWVSGQKEARLDILKASIDHLPAGAPRNHREKLAHLCEMWFQTSETFPALMAADMLRKFMWQAKRKMNGIPVTRHMMMVLVGNQDDGKTTFVQRMTAAVAEVRAPATFADLANDKIIGLWRNFVVTMDEMPYAQKTDADVTKNVVTCVSVSRRGMRTNDFDEFDNCTTLIGTTNYSLRELIYDTSGMRRFVELLTRAGVGQTEWDAVNAFDWLGLWQSVDHEGVDPSDEWRPLLKEKQEETRNLDPVEAWLATNNPPKPLVFDPDSKVLEVSADSAYLQCKNWISDYFPNLRPISSTKWGMCMTRYMGKYQITKAKKRNGYVYIFPLSADCAGGAGSKS